ncbi:MAG: hypothetical protein ACO1SV_08150 [Fimbriimonas sp.]
MAHCYLCGRPIAADRTHLRRQVSTGEWMLRDGDASRSWRVKTRLGMRVVCPSCAYLIDGRERREVRRWIAKVILGLAAIIAVLVLQALGALN